ncbi:MAG: heparinase II/III family protein, partial [Planctomycetaceae bacterium]|nr:heparinase II/III family protein [Planctomycetaceae bacterium]
ARHYPGFLVSRDWPHRPKGFALEPPYPNGGGKWGRWRYEEIPTQLVYAYDSICNSGELERLSRETGVDVQRRIEEDFFRGAIRQDGFHGPLYTNASPATYEGYAVVGRVLGDPSLVHEAVRRCRELLARQFFCDGFWYEGTVAYHKGTLNDLQQVFDSLRGYSDPSGHVDEQDGVRFDNLELESEIPVLTRARSIVDQCRYPDGRMTPFHDCGAIFARYRNLKPLERSVSTLLPGVGHAWLGRGEGQDQAQFHLHFSGAYGHHHADNLSLALFAHGDELLPDIGYTHSRLRSWASSTLGHNTVLIDELEQYTTGDKGPSDGRLLAWETTRPTVQWMEAAAERAYPGLAEVYRRAVMMVDCGGGDRYAVDLFRVEGGSQHDYVLHGSADHDSTAAVNVPLTPTGAHLLPGVEVRFPRDELDRGDAGGRNMHYGYVQNVASGGVTDGVMVTFQTADASRPTLRTHFPGLAGSTVHLGDAPSVRRADENNLLLDRFRMPVFLLRSHRPSTVFAAVHEPFVRRGFIEQVAMEQPVAAAGDAVALSVRHHGVTDHIVHRTAVGTEPLMVGKLQTDGEVAFVRERDGAPEQMALWGGTELLWGEERLTGDGNYRGTVTGVLRTEEGATCNALVVTGSWPTGELLSGATVIVTFGDGSTLGYPLTSVERDAGQMRFVLGMDPGVAISETESRQLCFPRRTIPGSVSYRIRSSAFSE